MTNAAENGKRIRVAAAVVLRGNRILATQRGYGNYRDWWEFPGGKIEAGETPEQALIREIREELAAEIEIERYLMTVEYDYPEFHLSMDCFICRAKDEITLLEHEAARWLGPEEFGQVRWLPADEEILNRLREELAETDEVPGSGRR